MSTGKAAYVLGVELANRESVTSWKDFLVALKARGLDGVEFVVSDDHEGLKRAIRETLPAGRGSLLRDLLRNALDNLMRRAGDDCLQELRWLYDRGIWPRRARTSPLARKWQAKHPKPRRVEAKSGEADLILPAATALKHMVSEQHDRGPEPGVEAPIPVGRSSPTPRPPAPVRALAVETHEYWIEAIRYRNMAVWSRTRRRRYARSTRPPDGGRRGRAPASRMRGARPRQPIGYDAKLQKSLDTAGNLMAA